MLSALPLPVCWLPNAETTCSERGGQRGGKVNRREAMSDKEMKRGWVLTKKNKKKRKNRKVNYITEASDDERIRVAL